ncbi:MAG: hypothetical protein HY046_06900, partial [Acidobacteria bacterium]|nr:hypothetical protein [Acidobacteriota bacterium]
LSGVVTGGLVLGLLKAATLLDVDLSARATAAQVQHWKNDPQQVRVHLLHRAWQYGLNFYLHRSIHEWQEGDAQDCLIVVSDDGLLDLLSRGYEVRVAQRMNKAAILVFAEKSKRTERPAT